MTSIYDCEVCNDKDNTIKDLREQCKRWETAWDEMRNTFMGFTPMDAALYGTLAPLLSVMDNLDPRKKEKG